MHISSGRDVSKNIIPDPDSKSYHALQKVKVLSETKHKHLQQINVQGLCAKRSLSAVDYTAVNTTMHALSLLQYCYEIKFNEILTPFNIAKLQIYLTYSVKPR